jgi:hypothetical protein
MVASVLVILFSGALVVYWFRYTCLLLLQDATLQETATDDGFSFLAVRRGAASTEPVAKLQKRLDSDYLVITAAGCLSAFEDRLLVWDYRFVRCWCSVARIVYPPQARVALREMADVLAVLSTKLQRSDDIVTDTSVG